MPSDVEETKPRKKIGRRTGDSKKERGKRSRFFNWEVLLETSDPKEYTIYTTLWNE